MKPIAIVFSDLHLGEYAQFNKDYRRTKNHFKVLFDIRKLCIKHDIPALFGGDLFHRPEILSNKFFEYTIEVFNRLDKKKWKMYCISGNHDMSARNTRENKSPSWVKTFSSVYKFMECIDFETRSFDHFTVSGVPYLDSNIGLNNILKELADKEKENHIVLLHTDYPGAQDTDGVEVGQVQNLNVNLLNPFKLTFIGHIHKPQRLTKKVHMVGAPIQQRRTDRDCKLGYWLLYEDFTLEFKELDKYPKFIDVKSHEEVKEDGNFYTVISNGFSEEPTTNTQITRGSSKRKLVRGYMKAINNNDKERRKILLKMLKDADA